MSADKYPRIFSRQMEAIVYITPARVDICPPIVSVEEKQSAQEFQRLFSSVNKEGNQTRFNKCSDSDITKLVPLAFLTCLREV